MIQFSGNKVFLFYRLLFFFLLCFIIFYVATMFVFRRIKKSGLHGNRQTNPFQIATIHHQYMNQLL